MMPGDPQRSPAQQQAALLNAEIQAEMSPHLGYYLGPFFLGYVDDLSLVLLCLQLDTSCQSTLCQITLCQMTRFCSSFSRSVRQITRDESDRSDD